MKFVDYHVHSNHSCDGKSTIFEMCQKAIELGIVEIGFSEHMDFEPKDEGFGFFNYGRYTSEIKSAQEFFKDKLVIRKGIEIDYQYAFEGKIRNWLKGKEFDFTVGSVHYLDHELISHKLKHNDLEKIYNVYFNEVVRSIESCIFDVLGHLDVIRKYVDNRILELKNFHYEERLTTILEEILEKKMYLEINSKLSMIKATCIDMIPCKKTVKEYIEKGGKRISIGSDAHSTEEIGSGVKDILIFLENYNGDKFKLLFE